MTVIVTQPQDRIAPGQMEETEAPPLASEVDELVYFHSGSGATYRKVNTSASDAFTVIPTIDIAKIDSPELSERKAIALNIHTACSTAGFFYIKNHGIPEDLVQETFQVLKRFFALDLETKMDAHSIKNPAIRGYEPMFWTKLDGRTKGDNKEAFTMGDCVIEPEQKYIEKTGNAPPSRITKPQNIWPETAPWFRGGLYKYYQEVLPLAMKLVRMFALAFDLPENSFDSAFKFPITGMRPLHYPPMPADSDENAVGLGAHADFSWLTLVLQDNVPALEVLNQDGKWVNADPVPGTLVCNVGQYLERQTNGIFQATVHRVRNKTGQERYSLPFFLTQDPDAICEVLPCCIGEGGPKFEPVNVGDLYIQRVLPARHQHPTAIKYKDVPHEEWKYDILLS